MLKKRIIFIIYYADGCFHLSRNFKLQRIGDISVLFSKFGFSDILKGLDELVILNVSRSNSSIDFEQYNFFVRKLLDEAFVPITLGGGLRNMEQVDINFSLGCDKVLFNTSFFENKNLINDTIIKYGSQAVVLNFDFVKNEKHFILYSNNGTKCEGPLGNFVNELSNMEFGELLINSVDLDGTGFGPETEILDLIEIDNPLILAGGFGKPEHFTILNHKKIDAVATGNIFNFLRGGLTITREFCLNDSINVRK